MSKQLLGSKIVIEEEQPGIRALPSVDTSIAGFVGVAEKGPIGEAVLCQSFAQYVKVFGGFITASNLTAAVEGFFGQGGTNLWVVRTAHYSDVTAGTLATAATASVDLQNATPVDTLTVSGRYHGAYANSYKIKISAATSGDSSEFNLEVLDSANLSLEVWPNLTMSTTAARYVETIINHEENGSFRISVEDLGVSGTTTQRRPANGTSSAMTGGNDGLTSLADADYVGSSASGTGLYAFDLVDDLTLLAVPGVASSTVHNAMITYAESVREGQVFCVMETPSGNTANQAITYVNSTAAIGGLTEHAAIYWPWIKVGNPNKTVFGNGDTITIPPSGHICGVIARTDSNRVGGVWDPPAGTENGKFFNVLGFETDEVLKEAVRDLVFPKRINPLTTMKGYPRFIDGARVLKGDGNFPTVAQRRGVSYCERVIKLGLQFARHKNNTSELRGTLYRTIFAFLKQQTDLKAFASTDPEKAFFVDFGDQLNPATTPNIVTGRIGLATVQPAEFIRLLFSQDMRAVEAELKG